MDEALRVIAVWPIESLPLTSFPTQRATTGASSVMRTVGALDMRRVHCFVKGTPAMFSKREENATVRYQESVQPDA